MITPVKISISNKAGNDILLDIDEVKVIVEKVMDMFNGNGANDDRVRIRGCVSVQKCLNKGICNNNYICLKNKIDCDYCMGEIKDALADREINDG